MSGAVNAVCRGGGKDRAVLFGPGGRRERVCLRVGEDTVAVILRPAARRRVDDVRGVALLQDLRSLVDVGVAVPLPAVGRHRKLGARGGNGRRRGHLRDIDALVYVGIACPARPDKVDLAAEVEDGAVDRPVVVARGDLPGKFVFGEGIFGLGRAPDVHPVIFVFAVVGGNVDVPAGGVADLGCGKVVQLGRPKFVLRVFNRGVACANDRAQLGGKLAKGDRAVRADLDGGVRRAVHGRRGGNAVVVYAVFFNDIGVGAAAADRVGKGGGYALRGRRRRHGRLVGKALDDVGGENVRIVFEESLADNAVAADVRAEAAARDADGGVGQDRADGAVGFERAFGKAEALYEIAARDVQIQGRGVGGGRHFIGGGEGAEAAKAVDDAVKGAVRNVGDEASRVDVHPRAVDGAVKGAARDVEPDVARKVGDRL